jgi:hypothetical protein
VTARCLACCRVQALGKDPLVTFSNGEPVTLYNNTEQVLIADNMASGEFRTYVGVRLAGSMPAVPVTKNHKLALFHYQTRSLEDYSKKLQVHSTIRTCSLWQQLHTSIQCDQVNHAKHLHQTPRCASCVTELCSDASAHADVRCLLDDISKEAGCQEHRLVRYIVNCLDILQHASAVAQMQRRSNSPHSFLPQQHVIRL